MQVPKIDSAKLIESLNEQPVAKPFFILVQRSAFGINFVLKNYAAANNLKLVDIRCAQIPSEEIQGLPYIDSNREVSFMKPGWYPQEPDSKGIIVFDEYDMASTEVANLAHQIATRRQLDCQAIPDGWRVIVLIRKADLIQPSYDEMQDWCCFDYVKM